MVICACGSTQKPDALNRDSEIVPKAEQKETGTAATFDNSQALAVLKEVNVHLDNSEAYKLVVRDSPNKDVWIDLENDKGEKLGTFFMKMWSHVDSPAMGDNFVLSKQPCFKDSKESDADFGGRSTVNYVVEDYKNWIFQLTITKKVESWFESKWKFI